MIAIINWWFLSKGGISLTNDDIEQMTDKIYARTKNVPGVDRDFIKKCLQGIASLRDSQVDARLKQLIGLI
jgi:hypothetical protein